MILCPVGHLSIAEGGSVKIEKQNMTKWLIFAKKTEKTDRPFKNW